MNTQKQNQPDPEESGERKRRPEHDDALRFRAISDAMLRPNAHPSLVSVIRLYVTDMEARIASGEDAP